MPPELILFQLETCIWGDSRFYFNFELMLERERDHLGVFVES